MLIHSISHFVVGVDEEEHEKRVNKALENDWLSCFMRCSNFSPIYHSAIRLKKMKKMARISTQFSCRLEVLDDKFLTICFLLLLGHDPEVGWAPDNLPIFCTGGSFMRLLRGNHVEKPLVHFFLNYSVTYSNLICIAYIRLS